VAEIATDEERSGSAWIVEQRRRIVHVTGDDDADPGVEALLPHLRRLAPFARATPGLREVRLSREQGGERLGRRGRPGGDRVRLLGGSAGEQTGQTIGGHPLESRQRRHERLRRRRSAVLGGHAARPFVTDRANVARNRSAIATSHSSTP
jgi:hypothetical protein